MSKLRKNKYIILAICVIIVSIVYFIVQKMIENYSFETNHDVVSDISESDFVENSEVLSADSEETSGKVSEDEINLLLEEEVLENDGGTVSAPDESEEKASDDNTLEESKIYVYITGEVNTPGVVVLNHGCRIVDAINAAGGTTIKANISKVNLVYVLEDGMKVNIPNDNDLKNNPNFEYITKNSGDGGRDDYINESTSSEGTVFEANSSNSSLNNSKNYNIVNINSATQTELETLPGIGPSLALKIINHRKENGKFRSIEEIKNVSGIGEAKFEKLKRYITV